MYVYFVLLAIRLLQCYYSGYRWENTVNICFSAPGINCTPPPSQLGYFVMYYKTFILSPSIPSSGGLGGECCGPGVAFVGPGGLGVALVKLGVWCGGLGMASVGPGG